MIKSNCKIENPDFTIPDFFIQFVDFEDNKYWVNDDRTLVFRLPLGCELDDDIYVEFIEFIGNSGSELSIKNFEGELFCRMYAKWWAEF